MATTSRAVRIGTKVTGLAAVIRDLRAIGIEVEDLKDAFSKIAAMGAKIAAGAVHSKTGRLAGDVRGNRARGKAVVTAGRASLPYAGVQNYGWPARNIAAQGFMQVADAVVGGRTGLQILEREVNRQIRKRGMA